MPPGLALGIIMDGNGRWATERGLPVTEGHRAGGDALHRVTEAALDLGVAELTVYAWSTENWSRSPLEVAGVMALFCELVERETPELHAKGVRMRFLGRRDRVPSVVVERMVESETLTAANHAMTLTIAFDHGGRDEIARAAQLVAREQGPDAISEASISAALDLPDQRDPDVIVRTAGERRSSNFMLWQSAYAEFIYTDTLWPDFDAESLAAVLDEYRQRNRTFGRRV